MAVYWMSFRIESNSTYSTRYTAVTEAIGKISTTWWIEPTSFIIFSSAKTINEIADIVKRSFNPKTDLAIIGMMENTATRLVGANDDKDIYKLIPKIVDV
jgi:hypothetical protein